MKQKTLHAPFLRRDPCSGYRFKVGAYIQVNCPAISATEWHPFSLFHVPGSRPKAGFHVEAVRTKLVVSPASDTASKIVKILF